MYNWLSHSPKVEGLWLLIIHSCKSYTFNWLYHSPKVEGSGPANFYTMCYKLFEVWLVLVKSKLIGFEKVTLNVSSIG